MSVEVPLLRFLGQNLDKKFFCRWFWDFEYQIVL